MMSGSLLSAPRFREPTYYADGWTDSDYYQGSAGAGRAVVGTVRLVGYLVSLPGSSDKIIAGNMSAAAYGWRIDTGLGADAISVIMGGSSTGWDESPRHTFVSGDVGSIFVLHAWCDSGGVHMAIGGAEVGTGSGSTITVTDPSTGAAPTIGRWQHATGYSNPHIGVINLSATATVLSLAEIAADAASIMARGVRLSFPFMPGEDMRYVARDIVATSSWHDRIADDATLTETGSVTVTEVT